MSARALPWFEDDSPRDLVRWVAAATIVAGTHAGLITAYLLLHQPDELASGAPVVMVELAPMPSAPEAQPLDLAPAPEEMVESKPQPEPEVQKPVEVAKIEPPPDLPPPPEAVTTVLPPPTPEKPLEQKEEPKKAAPKPIEEVKRPPAPRTTAPAPAMRQHRVAATPRLGANVPTNTVEPSWRDRLVAHLQRYKRYPGGAQSRHEEGVVLLSFSMDRNGHVIARHVARSSGHSELDAEVMAMIQRAQPLPSFPPSMTQSRLDLTVPIRFSLR
jgi:protein TonB